MARPLAVASTAWTLAILAAVGGVLVPSDDMRLSLALFAFAVALALVVGLLLVADGLRHRTARRHAEAAAASPLDRLEYLPSVTTGTRRISWRGAHSRVTPKPAQPIAATPPMLPQRSAEPPSGGLEDITMSAAG